MARRVVYYAWDDDLQDYVERPLDEADPWTMSLANLINGRNLSDQQFAATIKMFNAQLVSGG